MVAALPFTAAARAEAPSVLDLLSDAIAAIEAGTPPVSSVGWTSWGGPRTPSTSEARDALENARQRILAARDAESSSRGTGLAILAGHGSEALGLPYAECAPVYTDLFAVHTAGPPTMMLHDLATDFSLVPGEVCHKTPGVGASVLLDASPALATCRECAVRSAQAWSDGTSGTFFGDFRYVVHRGVGAAWSGATCYTSWCYSWAGFGGVAAEAEVYRGDALPAIALLKIPPDL